MSIAPEKIYTDKTAAITLCDERIENSDIEWIRADKVEENVRNAFDAGYTRGHDISGARLLRMIQDKEDDK